MGNIGGVQHSHCRVLTYSIEVTCDAFNGELGPYKKLVKTLFRLSDFKTSSLMVRSYSNTRRVRGLNLEKKLFRKDTRATTQDSAINPPMTRDEATEARWNTIEANLGHDACTRFGRSATHQARIASLPRLDRSISEPSELPPQVRCDSEKTPGPGKADGFGGGPGGLAGSLRTRTRKNGKDPD
jgi:hypothetical protein